MLITSRALRTLAMFAIAAAAVAALYLLNQDGGLTEAILGKASQPQAILGKASILGKA